MLDSRDRVLRSGFAEDQAAREFQVRRRSLHERSEGFETVPWDIKKREGKRRGLRAKKEKQKKANRTHSPFSVGSISGNSRKIVL